ncbi:MAG: ribonuclease R [Erysipelotrichaceae bacterium]|nr:ribonuclease R [Erysipelotrichaceae bacterium]
MKEKIVEYISSSSYSKESIEELSLSLNVDALSFKEFVKAINELEDDGTCYVTSKGYVHYARKINIFLGVIKSYRKYSSICELNDGRTVTIYNENMKNAYVNDYVRVHVNKDDSAEVIDVLSHNLWEVVATYKGKEFVVEENRFPYEIYVKNSKKTFHLVEGHVVRLKVVKYDDMTLICEIVEIIGHKNDPGMDILKCIIKSGVKYTFDEKLLDYTNKVVDDLSRSLNDELAKRKDLTKELIVTIDGLDAKDLDDAISLKINENGNYLLGVHIADVSHFVTKDSILDKEAFTRGTSIYLVDRVIPMLPHALCNGICSLNQDEIHLTMTCFMEIDHQGNVIDYEIAPSFIKSKARLDYDDVNALFDNKPTRLSYSKEIKEMLFNMKILSSILSKKMKERGYIELNIDEAKIIINEKNNKVIDIKKRVTSTAEKLIENFMILANETVASHIFYMQLPFIYRVHAPIMSEKLMALTSTLKEMNIILPSKQNNLTASSIQKVLEKVKGSDYEFVVNNLMLRSMSKAIYSTENIGHFGLASSCYTHFTSPIRRYPDLIVHRFLKKYLVEQNYQDETSFLIQAADNSSVNERKAMSLQREVEDMKKAEYMTNYIGLCFEGIITGVMDFGVFVQLKNTCEGLMRFDTIYGAYEYNYSYFQKQFKIGQKIMVKVVSTNISSGEINFSYVKQNGKKKGNSSNAKANH